MTFLNQALLAGLFAVSIPIIIHFLNRRRFQRVPWAAMRFLEVSVERNQRRMKLEDWILLAIRCALLAILAIALARPVVESLRGLPGSSVAAVVLIDNSASMGTEEGEGTRLDQARTAAAAVMGRIPAGSPVAIATPFQAGEATSDPALAGRRLAEVGQTDRHADLLSALERAAASLESQAAAEKEIYLITDGHAEEWSRFAALNEKLGELSAGRNVHVILVGSAAHTNLGISRLVPSGLLPMVGRPFRLEVEITNFGKTPAADIPVTVRVNEETAGEPWIIDELLPGRSENATVYATLPEAGYQRITVAIGDDAVPFDDRRTLVLRAVDEVRVLLVDGEPGAEPREGETFFLNQALVPVSQEERASYPVRPKVVTGSELAGENLEEYDAIVLANVADVPLAMAERISDHVEEGGGLMVFAGGNLRPEVYNTLFHARHGLLPVVLGSADAAESRRRTALVPADSNPLGFDREMLAAASVHTFSQLTQVPSAGSKEAASTSAGRVALRFAQGEPALVESEFGLGKVYLFASTADLAWSDLAAKPVFVPFVNRLLGGIVQQREANLNLQAGEVLRRQLDPAWAGKVATVYEVGDPRALGRLTTIASQGSGAVLEYRDTNRAGAYQATLGDQSPLVQFAARPSERESSLALLGSQQVDRIAETANVIRWPADSGDLGKLGGGSELWLLLLCAVIVLAAVELALGQWFSRAK